MKLTDIQTIRPHLATELERDNWTVEALATASPKQLTPYSGVGPITAKVIIKAAQKLVNEKLLIESAKPEPQIIRAKESPQRSARIQRIYEANK